MDDETRTKRGIHLVIAAGILGGNAVAALYLLLFHDLVGIVLTAPLAVFGGFLLIGLCGCLAGTMGGLAVRLVQEKTSATERGWAEAVITACGFSGAVGYICVRFLGAVWI
jgi:hypothetical protein